LLIVSIVAVSIVFGGSVTVLSAEPTGIEWNSNVDSAWKSAKVVQQPLLLFVTSDDCLYCRKMEAETYTHREVVSRVSKVFVATTAKGSEIPGLVNKLGIRVYPTTVIISPDAQVIDAMSGFVSASEMASRLAAATDAFKSIKR
jgi:protein disulfide-isomerase